MTRMFSLLLALMFAAAVCPAAQPAAACPVVHPAADDARPAKPAAADNPAARGEIAGAGNADSGAPAGATVRRVICLSPAVTEIVFALGAGDRVVGVSDYTFYPPEATRVTAVGGWMNPNKERLVSLAPDLVIIQGRHSKVDRFCRDRGIRLESVDLEDFAELYASIRRMGTLLGAEPAAEDLVRRLTSGVAAVREAVAGRPPVKVFLVVWRRAGSVSDLHTTTGGTFLDQALAAAGGINVFGDLHTFYPKVSMESLLARAPDVILEARAGEELSRRQAERLRSDWMTMTSLPAVKSGRVHILTEDYLLIPGPRVVQLVRRLAEILHPDIDWDREDRKP